jgi:SAM-dependent methyltransferase
VNAVERDPHKRAETESRTPEFMAAEATKPFGWESHHWVRWATIADVLRRLGIARGARVLDIGCGPGWTSLFLAESGYEVTAVDLVAANVELTAQRAARWQIPLATRAGDMEQLDLGERFDVVLIYDALHHAGDPRRALARAHEHLRPGGWLLLGETTWLHNISPAARRESRRTGWRERGFTGRRLRADLRDLGFVELRRFYQGTHPYESRGSEFVWQLIRLVAANFAVAPQAAIWLAGRVPD